MCGGRAHIDEVEEGPGEGDLLPPSEGVWGNAVSFPLGVWGSAPGAK